MANLCEDFEIFHERIALTKHNQAARGIARQAVRDRIRRYFHQNLNVRAPNFLSQGTCAANITVNPIGGEHYIEEGVYLQHLDKHCQDGWPSAHDVHQWLIKATQGYAVPDTDGDPACVRLRLSKHLQIALYCYTDLNGQYFQAVKNIANWSCIHPLALAGWFRSYVNQRGEQLRRIVRYITAWTDFQSKHRGIMPDASILTVLATYNFNDDYRDDLALAKTLEAISNYVRSIVYVLNPVNINEELSDKLTDTQKIDFQEAAEEAANIASAATVINCAHMASKLWRKLFGSRFPSVRENHSYASMVQNPNGAPAGLEYHL